MPTAFFFLLTASNRLIFHIQEYGMASPFWAGQSMSWKQNPHAPNTQKGFKDPRFQHTYEVWLVCDRWGRQGLPDNVQGCWDVSSLLQSCLWHPHPEGQSDPHCPDTTLRWTGKSMRRRKPSLCSFDLYHHFATAWTHFQLSMSTACFLPHILCPMFLPSYPAPCLQHVGVVNRALLGIQHLEVSPLLESLSHSLIPWRAQQDLQVVPTVYRVVSRRKNTSATFSLICNFEAQALPVVIYLGS